jgi:hypothetical protein
MFNHNQSSWTFDQHKAYAAEQERRARQNQQVEEARKHRRETDQNNR